MENSNCCDAQIINGICQDCKEHCVSIGESAKCKICFDEGFIEKTEWVGSDESYPITIKCSCQD